jgi:hypothetical protein
MGVRVTPQLDTINSLPVKADEGVEREPDVTFNGTDYIAVWSEGEYAGMQKVRAARITTQGAVLDSGILFGAQSYNEYAPCVASDGSRSLAIWYNYQTPYGVFGRFLDEQAQPVGNEFAVHATTTAHIFVPDIIYAAGRYLVVWNEQTPYTGDDIFGQIIDTAGIFYGGIIDIATGPGYQSNPRLAAGDEFLVTWNQNGIIYGQRLAHDGQLLGANFRISDTTSNDRASPDIAFGAENYLTAWMQFANGSYDIYGNLDITTGIEQTKAPVAGTPMATSTIMSGSLHRYLQEGCTVYDVSGRKIEQEPEARGVYFVRAKNGEFNKIIKVR